MPAAPIMPLASTLPCSSCGSRVEISTMRYNSKGTKLLCEKCYRKESEVINAIEDQFWGALSSRAITDAWGKEDEIWDKFAKKHGAQKP